MSIKSLFEDFKHMDKEERIQHLKDESPSLITFYFNKAFREPEKLSKIYEKMENEKIASSFAKMVKEIKKDENKDDYLGLASVFTDFLAKKNKEVSDEVREIYLDCIHKLLDKKAEKLASKADIPEELAIELLLVMPTIDVIEDKKYLRIQVQKLLKRLYAMNKENAEYALSDTKQVKKVMKFIFTDEYMSEVLFAILLERKDLSRDYAQTETWGTISNYALETLEDAKKEDLKEFLKDRYVVQRAKDAANGKDGVRRINFKEVSDEYEKINKVVEKLAEKEKVAKFL